jgi:GT2 family glycosyltransferase
VKNLYSHRDYLSGTTESAPSTHTGPKKIKKGSKVNISTQINHPLLTVIVVSYNTSKLLCSCLKSVDHHFKSVPYELFVVDNGSDDGSPERVRAEFPMAHLIENSVNMGFAGANNQALNLARGNYVMLLNSDTEVDYDVASEMIGVLRSSDKIGCCGPRLLNEDGSHQPSLGAFPTALGLILAAVVDGRMRGWFRKPRKKAPPVREAQIEVKGWLTGACLVIRRETLESVGLLDANFFFMLEDVDWCKRASDLGWGIVYVPSVTVRHLLGASRVNRAMTELEIQLKSERVRQLVYYAKKHHSLPLAKAVRSSLLMVYGVNFLVRTVQASLARSESLHKAKFKARLAAAMLNAV